MEINKEEYLKEKRKQRLMKNNGVDHVQVFINDIEFISSPNFSSRKKTPIDLIVIHYTGASTISSTINWFKKTESQVSCHYVIGKDGRTIRMVDDDKKAWHCGYSYYQGKYFQNKNSIGIELVSKGDVFTDEQYKSLIYLCYHLMKKYNISIENIVGHEDISGEKAKKFILAKGYPYSGKTDPGPQFNWAKLKRTLDEVSEEDKKLIKDEPIVSEQDIEELYKPQPVRESGKDPHDGTFLGLIIDFIVGIFNFKEKKK